MATKSAMSTFREKMVKKYGTAVTRQESAPPTYEVCSTGIYGLDYAIGTGGLIRGRIHQYWGPPGTGKTTACIVCMAEGQKQYPHLACGYIDMEQTFDWEWARNFGLDTSEERFFHVYPRDSEDVSDQIKEMCESGLFSHIVVDSIGGMESRVAFEKDASESNMGKNAQIITRMAKNIAVKANEHGVYVIFVNQVRANFAARTQANADMYSGPKNLKHQISLSIRFGKTDTPPLKVRENGQEFGVAKELRARVDRSKVGVEGRASTFWIINYPTEAYGSVGIDRVDEIITVGDLAGVISRAGAFYSLPNGDKFQGKDKLKEYLRANPVVVESLRREVMATRKHEIVQESEVDFVPELEDA